MGKNFFVAVLFLVFFCVIDYGSARNKIKGLAKSDTVRDDYKFENGKCALYCFWIPEEKNETISFDTIYHHMQHLRCSHLVYGFASIDSELSIVQPSSFDSIPGDYYGNFKRLSRRSFKKNFLFAYKLHASQVILSYNVFYGFQNNGTNLLYGVRVPLASNWMDNIWTHDDIARKLVRNARGENFKGIFLHVDSELLLGADFEKFMHSLITRIQVDSKFYSQLPPLTVVLSISAEWAPHVASKLGRIEHYFNAFYLWSDDTAVASDSIISTSATSSMHSQISQSLTAAHVDPLESSKRVLSRDTIQINAMKLVNEGGIDYEKIIIGLTAWARSYVFSQHIISTNDNAIVTGRNSTMLRSENEMDLNVLTDNESGVGHGSAAAAVGAGGPKTRRKNGRQAFHEICKIPGFENAVISSQAASASFFGANRDWYSFNAPDVKSLGKKLKWIGAKGFGGVGLYNIQSDDINNACGLDKFPLHKFVAKYFRCNIARRNAARMLKNGTYRIPASNGALNPCTRICTVDTKHRTDTFTFERLKPEYCSHVIISSLLMDGETIGFTERFRETVDDFSEWLVERKPLLILSIGATQESRVWRTLLYTQSTRTELLNNILQHVEMFNADGINIAWTHNPPDTHKDFSSLIEFMTELREKMPQPKKILLTVSSSLKYYLDRFNISAFTNPVDHIIVQGYRFHSYRNYYTGHHSPLFAASHVLNDAKNTIEGTMNILSKQGMETKKLIVGLSAEALTQNFLTIADGVTRLRDFGAKVKKNRRDIAIDRQIGDRAAPYKKLANRTHEFGAVTQTEVCEVLKDANNRLTFIDDIGAPYLVSGKEFIAFDDERSIQIKTVWASMNGYGGVAMNAIEMDNAGGVCPSDDPFHLLRTMANAQVCNICNGNASQNISVIPTSTNQPNGSTATRHTCTKNKKKFNIICNYQLPELRNAPSNLAFTEIPFADCDEIVIEEAFIKMSGEIVYIDPKGDSGETVAKYLAPIKDLVKEKQIIISSVRCLMSEKNFEKLISDSSREKFINAVISHLDQFGFSGIEFRCDELLSGNEKIRKSFSIFLNQLYKELNPSTTNEKEQADVKADSGIKKDAECSRMINLRVPIWKANANLNYNISDINSIIHHISIEQNSPPEAPAQVFAAIASSIGANNDNEEKLSAIVNPMFDVPSARPKLTPTLFTKSEPKRNFNIDISIRNLIESGVRRSAIILQIPTYGILHKPETNSMVPVLTAKRSDLEFLSSEKVCKLLHQPDTVERWLYDRVTGFAKTGDKNQLSYETQKTVNFKTKYAMRENLGGVVLDNLNLDDIQNECHNGDFSLLKAARNAIDAQC